MRVCAKAGALDREVAGDALGPFMDRNQGPKTP